MLVKVIGGCLMLSTLKSAEMSLLSSTRAELQEGERGLEADEFHKEVGSLHIIRGLDIRLIEHLTKPQMPDRLGRLSFFDSFYNKNTKDR